MTLADGCGGDIYYEACTDIGYGSELLVWYGDGYVQFMGIPIGMVDYTSARQTSPLLSGFNEINAVNGHEKLDVGVNSETNCESFIGLLRHRPHRLWASFTRSTQPSIPRRPRRHRVYI